MNNKFTFYWLTGRKEVLEGNDVANAFNSGGYSAGALSALDFYESGDKSDSTEYTFVKNEGWVRNK